jgi:hypothetical protein
VVIAWTVDGRFRRKVPGPHQPQRSLAQRLASDARERDAYGGKDLNHCDYWNQKSIKISLLGAEIREASGLVWMYLAEHPKVVLCGLMAEHLTETPNRMG